MDVVIGPEIIKSYKRLSYTPWHAFAEFVDNSTQSFLDNIAELTPVATGDGPPLHVEITYSPAGSGSIVITDNAMGMSREELASSLHIGRPPERQGGRSEFGMGLKTAACWFGDQWTVRTKKLGEEYGGEIQFNVEDVADGNRDLPYEEFKAEKNEHYTEVRITHLNQRMTGNQIKQVRRFLESMYRVDTRDGLLLLTFDGDRVVWESPISSDNVHRVEGEEGERCHLEFPKFEINGKDVSGWIALMERGSRANAGFTIIRRGRVIKGYPDPWRPREIFGQYQGSNDLVNQRLVGEIHLDRFDVSHTKDDILWGDDEEAELGQVLRKIAQRFVDIALSYRRLGVSPPPPSRSVIRSAIGLLEEEMNSVTLQRVISANGAIPEQVYEQRHAPMIKAVGITAPTGSYNLHDVTVDVHLAEQLPPTDPYVGVQINGDDTVTIVVNMNHPHVKSLRGRIAVFNHLKACTYEGLAEWKADKNWRSSSPLLIRAMKDVLLRVGQEVYDQPK